MKSGPQMLAVIEKLEDAINFHDFKTRANLGDVYEQMLNDLRGAGNAGEFYTPRAITAFMADRVNPRLDKRESVMDPACGTGGFLTAAIDHFRHQLSTKSSAEDKHAIENLIHGIEKKQLPHLLCTTNMLLHGIDVPSQIEHKNTLAIGWNEWSANDKVDCIITNPPLAAMKTMEWAAITRLICAPAKPPTCSCAHHQKTAERKWPRRRGATRWLFVWRWHQRHTEKNAAA